LTIMRAGRIGVAAFLVLIAPPAAAQYVARGGFASTPGRTYAGSQSARPDTTAVRGAPFVRGFTAFAGWIPAAYLGGYVAYNALPHRKCGCDDPGLYEAAEGVVVGGGIGAALGAAMPGLGSHCSFASRLGFALIGSATGTAVGFLPQGSARLVSVPLLSIVGAALGEVTC
jgi:hypothetical protein